MNTLYRLLSLVALSVSLCITPSFAEELQFTLLAERNCDGPVDAPYSISESQQFTLPDNVLRYITFTTVRTGGMASVLNPSEEFGYYNLFSHFWITTSLDIPGYWSHDLTTHTDSLHESGSFPGGSFRSFDLDYQQTKRSQLIDFPVCAPAQPLTIGVQGECYTNESGGNPYFAERFLEVTVRFVYRPLPEDDTSCG